MAKRRSKNRSHRQSNTVTLTKQRSLVIPKRIPISLPANYWFKFKYVEGIQLNPGVGSVASWNFRSNSLFDPDKTGVGHQPLYFDEIARLYNRYAVYKSVIRVRPVPETGAVGTPGVYGILNKDEPTLHYLSAPAIIESRESHGQYRVCAPGLNNTNTKGAYPSVSKTYNALKVSGATDDLPSTFTSAIGTNPSNEQLFTVWYGSINGNDPGACTFMCEIEYITKMSDPVYVGQS